jgi:hypothetical protein
MPMAFFGKSNPDCCQKDRNTIGKHDRMAIFVEILKVHRSNGLTLNYET